MSNFKVSCPRERGLRTPTGQAGEGSGEAQMTGREGRGEGSIGPVPWRGYCSVRVWSIEVEWEELRFYSDCNGKAVGRAGEGLTFCLENGWTRRRKQKQVDGLKAASTGGDGPG